VIPDSQARFRNGRGTMGNVTKNELKKKGGRMIHCLEPGVCGRFGNCGRESKRNERNDEEAGKVCEEEKAGSEC
jgi:hypothetical protein